MAFFVIDQRHPLPTPTVLPPLATREEERGRLLAAQLQPRGTFGFDSRSVYSTGNGSVADVGWMRSRTISDGGNTEAAYPDAASLIHRLNLAPPTVERGTSMMLQAPRTQGGEVVTYNAESCWAEVWIGEGQGADCLYVDMTWGSAINDTPPDDGVSEVKCFPGGMGEFATYVEEQGFWTDDETMRARLDGKAVELVVAGQSSWGLTQQLAPIVRLRDLPEGSRCELGAHLDAFEDDAPGGEADEYRLPFKPSAWADAFAFIKDPSEPLVPLAEARRMRKPLHSYQHSQYTRALFGIKVNAVVLGYRALEKAANAALEEVDSFEVK